MKKYKPSPAELRWDESLRWNDYKYGEAMEVLQEEDHRGGEGVCQDCGNETDLDGVCRIIRKTISPCRFVRREGDEIVIATMTLAELPFRIPKLSIRRPVFTPKPLTHDEMVEIVAGAHATFGTRHLPKER